VKFLLDQNVSPEVRIGADTGDAIMTVHVRSVGLASAADEEVLEYARREGFVLVSQDTDFTNLLFREHADRPSLILLRDVQEVTAGDISQLITVNLKEIAEDLERGAVVSIMPDRVRVRPLPIGRSDA
jgi:predicted nuclease of predicted toxin-antitoxin system